MESHGIIDDLLISLNAGSYLQTPSQYADARRSAGGYLPERRLFATAFEVHLRDCREGKRKLEALEWLKSDADGRLSFRWYCEVLGLDATAVRARFASGTVVLKRTSPASTDLPISWSEDRNGYMRAYRKAHPQVRDYNRKWRGIGD